MSGPFATRTEIRAGLAPYLIFGAIGILCVVFSAFDRNPVNLLMSVTFLGALMLWIRSFKIVINGDRLSSTSWLGSFSVARSDVSSIRPLFFAQRSIPIALIICVKTSANEFRLSLKPFSEADARTVLSFFG
jgi:hypothetical protein